MNGREAVLVVSFAALVPSAGCNLISRVGDIVFEARPDAGAPGAGGSGGGPNTGSGGGPNTGSGSGADAGSCASAPQHCAASVTMCSSVAVDTSVDATNCGGCGRLCGETCRCSKCEALVELAGAQDQPWSVAVDAVHGLLYWTNKGSPPTVMSAPTSGCGAASRPYTPSPPLGSTADQVGIGWNDAGGIWFAPRGAVTSDAQAWYFTDATLGNPGMVLKAPFGGTSSMLATKQQTPAGIVVTGGIVYWADFDGAVLMMATADGGAPTQFAFQGQGLHPWRIAVDESRGRFYWTAQDKGGEANGAVMTMPIGATASSATTFAAMQNMPFGILVDAGYVYWTNAGAGTVVRKSELDGSLATIAVKQAMPQDIVADAQGVYWVNAGSSSSANGTVMKWVK